VDLTDAFESLERLKDLTEEIDTKDKEIRSREKMLRTVANRIEIAIWGKGLDGRFVFMNSVCAEKILRTTIENGLAMTDEDFKHDALASVCMSSDKLVLETGKTHRFIEYAVYVDGRLLFLDTTKSPWLIDDLLVGTVGFGRDITKFVPEEVKNRIKESGCIEIPIDLMYNASDLIEIMKNAL
jgi:PAS domain-containing protein